MRVTKSYHDAPEGIELTFDPELRHEGLQKYLGALGFKEANRKKGVWYIRGKRPSYDRYTDALVKAYNDGKDVMEVVIQPSYEPSLENITHKMFSLVTATITTDGEEDKDIDYVIFEDFRVSAFDIANRFLKQQYGDRLKLVRVTAKNLKGRAEKALAKEQIIINTSLSEIVEEKSEKELSVAVSHSLTNDAGVYTEALATDRYEEIQIPMPSKLKFEARIALVRDEQEQYVYGVNVINNLSGWGGYGFAPSKGDAAYPTKSEAIQAAILQILDGVQYEHTEALGMGASEALQAAYKKTILAIYDFAERIEINIPQENSKAVLPLSMDEETPKNAEGTTQSTLNTFDKDVAMLVDELRELETQVEDKGIAFTIGNAKIDLEESFEKFTGKLLNDQLKRIYSGLLDLGNTLSEGTYRDQFFSTLEKLKNKAGILPFKANQNYQFTIIQGHTVLKASMIRAFQSFIELHRNALHIIYQQSKKDGTLSILKVRISSDRDTINFLHRKEDNTLKIDGLELLQEEMVSYNGTAVPAGKLKKAIRYMLTHPKRLRIQPAEVYRVAEDKAAISTEILYQDKPLANVLIPEGVPVAYDFGTILKHSKNDIKAAFPWLFEIDEEYLIYVIPSQLFILSQFSNLETLGISVKQQELHAHWMHYGEQLFELLGYPTDMDYPYVSTQVGYDQVMTLGAIIESGGKGKHWWKAIEGYRPIADMELAIQYLDEIIALHKENEINSTDMDTTTKRIATYIEQRNKIQKYITSNTNLKENVSAKITADDIAEVEVKTTEIADEKVYTADITNYKMFTPNVLIPKGIIAPFDSGSVSVQDAEEIRETASHLLAVTDANLGKQDAKTMFELSQMPHPKDYGFGVNRAALLRNWEKRGKTLLEELGYPTDLDYPYVNIHRGYKSVAPLGHLIDIEKEGNQWWNVVEHARPIADMEIALVFIAKEIEILVKIRLSYTNPKTGKPKTKQTDIEQYRALTFAIENFEHSKTVIEQYLEDQQQQVALADTSETEETVQKSIEEEHLSNILLPERIVSPFITGDITPEQAVALEEPYFYLFRYTYRNLHWASPLELFMLLQFRDLKASGIPIPEQTLYRVWENEGASLLTQLEYPTIGSYPYVRIDKGYLEVLPLEAIITKVPDTTIWWSAVKHYRPVADLQKAVADITVWMDSLTEALAQETLEPNIAKLSEQISQLRHSKNHLEAHLHTAKNVTEQVPEEANKEGIVGDLREIPEEEADRIRRQFTAKGFKVAFTAKTVFDRNLSVVELNTRDGYHQTQLEHTLDREYDRWIAILEKEIEKLSGKTDAKSNQSRTHREDRISALLAERSAMIQLVVEEARVFYDDLFVVFIEKAKAQGYAIDRGSIADFRLHMMTPLCKGRLLEHYPDMPIRKATFLLIDDYFKKNKSVVATPAVAHKEDYLDRVIAIMHDHYIEARRLGRKKIEAIKEEAGVPNMGVLWEAVELSWLLWYKNLYNQPSPFNVRLRTLVQFWDQVQPTYAYSDSSKEQYKQYSTPCPIGAMIAEYTEMAGATRIFEPSAGNGLLVVGADPSKTHVNEIDNSRRKSLEFQGFAKITHYNAAEPFPDELTHAFDVVVTNPPFDRWSADAFDKDRLVKKYFDSNIGLNRHLRLEHLMSGLALHTMKDSGKAALIIKGHIKFREDDGYMATYKPFFNWLYSRYVVDDVINMNGYKLYNKQGAVTEMMLVLIGGRKPKKSKKVAPNRGQAGYLADIAESFEALWERIRSHIKTPLQKEIEKLKIALGYDIF